MPIRHATMIPAGYMAKHLPELPEWLKAVQVARVYSVSPCIAENFADYINYWRHNGYWLFDSPHLIREVAAQASVDLTGTALFYYETLAQEFLDRHWTDVTTHPAMATDVCVPAHKCLEGFDVVTFSQRNAPECSPLSCNSLAASLPTNASCLFASLEEALSTLEAGAFEHSEPGPYRIFAVYSLDWS